jgi:hypothetical protein
MWLDDASFFRVDMREKGSRVIHGDPLVIARAETSPISSRFRVKNERLLQLTTAFRRVRARAASTRTRPMILFDLEKVRTPLLIHSPQTTSRKYTFVD